MYITTHFVCFYGSFLTKKYIEQIPFKDIVALEKKKAAMVLPNAIEIKTNDKTVSI